MPFAPFPPGIAPLGPPPVGGLQFKHAAPLLCGVVDNGVCADDPRVLTRLNEATKIIMDTMIPVGGMLTAVVQAENEFLILPPQLENSIEAYPYDSGTLVRGDSDIAQGWYEIINNSTYLDPFQHHDNPLVDWGFVPDAIDPSVLRRVYQYPGLQPKNAQVVVTGKKRFISATSDESYLIVQNIEALKLVIQSIERIENNQTDDGLKIRAEAMKMLEGEAKQNIMDPRNYMRRKSAYQDDSINFPENTLGWVRGNIALDIEEALKTGKIDLTWSINQVERRLMQNGKIYKDMVTVITTEVVGGVIYFPINVSGVLAVDLDGQPIPIRSQFFQSLENGPGMFPCSSMLIYQGDQFFSGSDTTRRKYKLVADCQNGQTITAVCQLRWIMKEPADFMTIKNYEAIRLMMTSKFQEEKEKWNEAKANQQEAYSILDKELQNYLAGIRHTVHIQTMGFGLNDVGGFWNQ